MLEIERESRSPNDSYVDWVIVGGESGSRARPMHPNWVRCIRDQCLKSHVPFFFKQWGEWLPEDQFGADGDKSTVGNTGARWGILNHTGTNSASDCGEVHVYRVGKRNAGRLLDGDEWNGTPQWIR
jgi:hypothetical protein